ncbi:toll/interleukin-1 receptor domain-containing protein [Massilia sp. TS11]|uniref:toll/interleukin-1 receptor domain-containing protein n=1 Tax=Massilia sp. TS11 TaxID=2908003 RepID=UPI001EDAC344|nr:toll/interleukin-1 receptor domain-containing protein [Massilia sp. TS11]MCG2584069.1 toll/interleukin-1 receptor domain-containing protein [Massilia sp. TS11]
MQFTDQKSEYNVEKAFLSHNSFDKDFVSEVYAKLGSARAIYDAETFRRNCDVVSQIREGFDDATVYALFLSKHAIQSGWVKNEVDLAAEFKSKWKITKFLVFQLDETPWTTLPEWLHRYIVSCPPSPELVALRIKDELSDRQIEEHACHGRDITVRRLIEMTLSYEPSPTFYFLSGPQGIGRRTIIWEVYKTLFKQVQRNRLLIELDEYTEMTLVYRRLLGFSANWRAFDLVDRLREFTALSENAKVEAIAVLINEVTVKFKQTLIFDLGRHGFEVNGDIVPWVHRLLQKLPSADYPYLIVLSSRATQVQFEKGIALAIDPLDESDSKYLFKLLLKEASIEFPDKRARDSIEGSVVGHPGLIASVVRYLRMNPRFQPTRTHNSLIIMINAEVESMLRDFLKGRPQAEIAVGLFAEAHIISFGEVVELSKIEPMFEEEVNVLVEAGFLIYRDGYYQLAPYIQRYAQIISAPLFERLAPLRKVLFASTDGIASTDFVPLEILDARIVSHFTTGVPVSGYLTNLVMPAQQLKAARRLYDQQRYGPASKLAHEAYGQSSKMSPNGILEAWRLIGLCAARTDNQQEFSYFTAEYPKIPAGPRRDAHFNFAEGFYARLRGDFRKALERFKKIEDLKLADHHVYRELGYLYAFEGNYDLASRAIERAVKAAGVSPYVLDVQALVLLERYRREKGSDLADQIEACLHNLRSADIREGTRFHGSKAGMWKVIEHGDMAELQRIFTGRNNLPIQARILLLDILSNKGKDVQYTELLGEISKSIRESSNKPAQIEVARVEIRHLAAHRRIQDARTLLNKYRQQFTEGCAQTLEGEIRFHESHISARSK